MNCALVSDLHFTPHARDAYRWRLFDWLAEIIRAHNVSVLFVLGDLTEAKDYHSSRTVNKLADGFRRLDVETYVLRGNHDGLDPNLPYFNFLRHFPKLHFVTTPFMRSFADRDVAMLPHTKTPEVWAQIDWLRKSELCFMHATVDGAIGENGYRLDGFPPALLMSLRGSKIYSGDIHVPQTVEGVEYVGAPYPVRFGDKYPGRVVVLENFRKPVEIINEWAPRRRFLTLTAALSIDDIEQQLLDFRMGDQVKVRIALKPHEYVDWDKCKKLALQIVDDCSLELHGLELQRIAEPVKKLVRRSQPLAPSVTPAERLRAYCAQRQINAEAITLGEQLLKDAQNV